MRLTRRHFTSTLLTSPLFAQVPVSRYEPTWESIRRHQVPDWFHDAKLGIFIHWGLYSVPAWAPPTGELGKVDRNRWFHQNPYAEWYLNSLRLQDTPTAQYHAKTYGADFDYYRFAEEFNRETSKWDPTSWASLFRDVGARYVVLTTKHHDGFTLWPSRVVNPRRPGLAARRDLVGDLTQAVRAAGLRMGLYYSGGLDWTFETRPIATFADVRGTVPQTEEYARYADAHWFELIERYQPAILWNDISYPRAGKILEIFARFYNTIPDGVVNNRFGVDFADFTTPEYAQYDRITEKKWESCRGLGYSFGYNRAEGPEHVIAPEKLITLFIDIVSKNGNLLLNIGPRPDGSISDIQLDRLNKLGAWLKVYGQGLFGSRPWVRPSAISQTGDEFRFTRKGDSVWAWWINPSPKSQVTLANIVAPEGLKIRLAGSSQPVAWQQQGRDLLLSLQAAPPRHAVGFQLTPVPWQVVRD